MTLVYESSLAHYLESKWVFKAKKNIAGNIVYYKVTQKFSQVSGVDTFDTFASFAKLI